MGTLIGLLILIIAVYAIYKYAESQVENDKKRMVSKIIFIDTIDKVLSND